MSRYVKSVSGVGKVPSADCSGRDSGSGTMIAGRDGCVKPKTTFSVWTAASPSLR